jgi:hypothetical protein
MPSTACVSPSGAVAFTASGGTLTSYVWSFGTNQSGGTINSSTGAYAAGTLIGIDTITVTDSGGNTCSVPVQVQNGPTLSQLRTAAQQRCDRVNSTFVTSSEWASYINSSALQLYSIIVEKFGDDYSSAPPLRWTTDGVTERYQLPPDFFKLLGVDLLVTPNQPSYRLTVYPFNRGQRNKYSPWNVPIAYGMLSNLHYRLDGKYLWFTPFPASGQQVQIEYVPVFTQLVNDTDVLNTGVLAGFDEYVVLDAAIKAMVKEESDASALMAQKGEVVQQIEIAAENRDAGMPVTVTDSNWSDMWWPGGSGGYGGVY